MKPQKKTILLVLSSIILLSACVEEDPIDIGDGGGSRGSDTLKINKTGAEAIHIEWNKKSSGYSEVTLIDPTDSSKEGKRGQYFLTNNYKGMHTLDCYYGNIKSWQGSDNGKGLVCEGIGASIIFGNREIKRDIKVEAGKTYKMRINYGIFNITTSSTLYTIRYSSGNLSVVKH